MTIELLQGDCMDYMRTLPDNAFDLAIVDPPYGIGISSNPVRQAHKKKAWDSEIPKEEYFKELFRVSRNQIIWGGNYMTAFLPSTASFIIWDKVQPEEFSMAMCEFAWSSFGTPAKVYKLRVVGADKERIHPTQKPVKLYEWLLKNYAKPGDKILDTHLGSGSSAIAAHYSGFAFVGIELDEDYYKAACKRFDEQTKQVALF